MRSASSVTRRAAGSGPSTTGAHQHRDGGSAGSPPPSAASSTHPSRPAAMADMLRPLARRPSQRSGRPARALAIATGSCGWRGRRGRRVARRQTRAAAGAPHSGCRPTGCGRRASRCLVSPPPANAAAAAPPQSPQPARAPCTRPAGWRTSRCPAPALRPEPNAQRHLGRDPVDQQRAPRQRRIRLALQRPPPVFECRRWPAHYQPGRGRRPTARPPGLVVEHGNLPRDARRFLPVELGNHAALVGRPKQAAQVFHLGAPAHRQPVELVYIVFLDPVRTPLGAVGHRVPSTHAPAARADRTAQEAALASGRAIVADARLHHLSLGRGHPPARRAHRGRVVQCGQRGSLQVVLEVDGSGRVRNKHRRRILYRGHRAHQQLAVDRRAALGCMQPRPSRVVRLLGRLRRL
eukprot:scaffold1375_cov96-Isochrysis_galbana.AAC.4